MKQQEEIERLAEEICCNSVKCERKCDGCPLLTTKKNCIKMANIVLSQQWKSVEDELPETEGEYSEVFVKLFDKDIEIYSVGCFTKNKEWYVEGWGYTTNVSHWMYIPKIS